MASTALPLIRVEHLTRHYPVSPGLFRSVRGYVHAVDDISFNILPGQSLGLVGESGCGKTTTGKLLVRLVEPTSGTITMQNDRGELEDIAHFRSKALQQFRRRAQIIFQDPYASINPHHTIYEIVAEPLAVHRIGTPSERRERAADLLGAVGLTPAGAFMSRFPHELSGGQRQRAAIARALILTPRFVVADEPTSMLDVSIRIGVMQLMADLAGQFGVSYLYITHDLAVARYMCHDIAVMVQGQIVERAGAEELLAHPLHPHTRALLAAAPALQPRASRAPVAIQRGASRPLDPLPICRFYARCPLADHFCRANPPPPLEDRGGGHYVACYK